MPRNNLKSFPTARLRRGLAAFHPGIATVMPAIDVDADADADGTQPVDPPDQPGPDRPTLRRPTHTAPPDTLDEATLCMT